MTGHRNAWGSTSADGKERARGREGTPETLKIRTSQIDAGTRPWGLLHPPHERTAPPKKTGLPWRRGSEGKQSSQKNRRGVLYSGRALKKSSLSGADVEGVGVALRKKALGPKSSQIKRGLEKERGASVSIN